MSNRMLRYTADWHLYDIASMTWRTEPIEDKLVDAWNNIVDDDDITFIIGDLGKQCPESYNLIRRLNGTKILVMGNHDWEWQWDDEAIKLFDGIHQKIAFENLLLVHDPDDAKNIESDWVIHGHLHTYRAEVLARDHTDYVLNPHRFNCAVDMTRIAPCTIEELMYYKSLYVDENPT